MSKSQLIREYLSKDPTLNQRLLSKELNVSTQLISYIAQELGISGHKSRTLRTQKRIEEEEKFTPKKEWLNNSVRRSLKKHGFNPDLIAGSKGTIFGKSVLVSVCNTKRPTLRILDKEFYILVIQENILVIPSKDVKTIYPKTKALTVCWDTSWSTDRPGPSTKMNWRRYKDAWYLMVEDLNKNL